MACSGREFSLCRQFTYWTIFLPTLAELQPMDLDCAKSKNPPRICYNCNKPGHITQNCLEPHMQQVHNTDPLSLETIQAIVEAVRIAVGGDAMRGEGATGNVEPVRSEAKELQDF